MTVHIDDEKLSAWIDGELPEDEARTIADAIAQDASLRKRADMFAEANALVGDFAALADAAPMPASVANLLDAARADNANSNVVPLRASPRSIGRFWPTAIAASAAAIIGYIAGAGDDFRGDGAAALLAAGPVASDGALFAALETTPSGASAEIGAGTSLTPVFSFRTADNRLCREIQIDGATAAQGLACRQNSGWRIEVAAARPNRARA